MAGGAAPIRFFVDADLMSVGMALAQVRHDVTHPGHRRAEGIVPSTPDPEWLPIAGANGWLVLSKDRRIRSHPVNRRSALEANAKVVFLTGNKTMNSWDRLCLIVRHWDAIEARADVPGPWLMSLTGNGLHPLPGP